MFMDALTNAVLDSEKEQALCTSTGCFSSYEGAGFGYYESSDFPSLSVPLLMMLSLASLSLLSWRGSEEAKKNQSTGSTPGGPSCSSSSSSL